MSRSYKKTPHCHCSGKDPSAKKAFNRRVRRTTGVDFEQECSNVSDGNAYRKLNPRWKISDGRYVGPTLHEYPRWCRRKRGEAYNEKEANREWIKYYKGK